MIIAPAITMIIIYFDLVIYPVLYSC